ncbi:MAG: hypothetical protein AB7U48_05855, partial [Bauldia sp.]
MNPAKSVLAFAALIVPAVAVAQPVPKPKPTPPPAAAAPAPAEAAAAEQGTVTVGGITLRYPSLFVLAESAEEVATQGVIPPCDPDFGACLYYAAETYADTNFESAGLRIQERTDLATEEACVSEQPEGYTGLTPTIRREPGYVVATFTDLGDAGAGHFTQDTLYRVVGEGACYEFTTRIGQTQLGNYTPGTIKPFTDGDAATVQGLFAAILNSATLANG